MTYAHTGRQGGRRRRSKMRQPSPPLRHAVEVIDLPADGRLRLAIVADTHSSPHSDALDLLRRERPDRILHGGDIGELRVLDELGTVAPVIAVRGNIDGAHGPPDTVKVELRRFEKPVATLLLMHIAVRGPRLRKDALELARKHGAQVVVCGHSHVPLIGVTDGVAVFNPGSIGPRRFRLPITFGVLDVSPDGLSFRHVDCETGDRWSPH